MLINARTPGEARIAIIEGSTLEDYKIEVAERGLTRGNIYRGRIDGIESGLNAAFIDWGAARNGFLPIQDVVPEAFYRQPKEKRRPRIDEVLEVGRPIVVQVTREPEEAKGAAMTTDLSFAGRYLVLTPFDDQVGISRKVEDEATRRQLRKLAKSLQTPPGCGVIVRTNALDQTKTVLNRDLNALLRLWKQVSDEARRGQETALLYSDQDLILQALRDYLDSSIQEIVIDDEKAFAKVKNYIRAFLPRGKTQLVRHTERTPLFSRYELEPKIAHIFERRVELPSGGSIVIDRTEALIAIDVNSGRGSRGASQEETAFQTDLEAASELARQLRLRDIGGLVVVDFIDMKSHRNQSKVVTALREAMKPDKARHTIGRISSNGLLEINRQRIEQALSLRTHRSCPTCEGSGRIASSEMVSLNLLRQIESRAAAHPVERVRVSLHPELADAFQNDRRQEIAELEREFDLTVEVIAASHLHRSDQELEWFHHKGKAAKPKAPKDKAAVEVQDLVTSKEKSTGTPTARKSTRRRRRKPQAKKPSSEQEPKTQTTVAKDSPTKSQSGDQKSHPRAAGSGRTRRRGRRRSAKKSEAPKNSD